MLNERQRVQQKVSSVVLYNMEESYLYKVAEAYRNEFYNTRPYYIEEADIFPIVHNNPEGIISGWIEVSLNSGNAYASYNTVEISRKYADERSCEKAKNEVISYLVDYFEKVFCASEIRKIWQYVESGDLKWHPYTRYTLPYSSYIEDVHGIYDTIKMCEVAIFLTKPEEIKKIKLIPYFDDLGQDGEDATSILLISIDARVEKENEYHQFVWTSTADGYDKNKSKEEAEEELVEDLLDILNGVLSDDEILHFWDDVPWDKHWKPIH